MTVLVTGVAGFIGSHVARALLDRGDQVIGIDNLNDYYDPALKEARLAQFRGRNAFSFQRLDVSDRTAILALVEAHSEITRVAHLAAQAGVRYSLENPFAYIDANVMGQQVMIEACRRLPRCEHFVYASSSSVYGANRKLPFSVEDPVDHPVSLYAATKRAGELMAYTAAHLYRLPSTGLRFFTVYGPWGRPDMSPFIFVRRILEGEPIDVFNHGDHQRDFTYIDDIVEGVVRTSDRPAAADPGYDSSRPDAARSSAPWRIFNIGCERPVELLRYIEVIEECTGRQAIKNMLPLQPGDVKATYADVSALAAAVGYRPKVSLEEGMSRFVAWYRDYYGL